MNIRTSTNRVFLLIFTFVSSQICLADSTCLPDGVQNSGSIYRICMPDAQNYNGSLVIWAHGFQDAGTPVQIPEDQIEIGGVSLPLLMNELGFAFATNSYSKTGLAIRQGMDDILDLVEIFTAEQSPPQNIYLVGASEGGIITTLLVEQRPEIFKGGVAACGPIGDFPSQLNYFGDARALFDVYFPGLIPGEPFNPPQYLMSIWANYYAQVVEPIIFATGNQGRLAEYAAVAKLPFDNNNVIDSLKVSIRDVLNYGVVNLHDATTTLGGFPYDNASRWYTGSSDDVLLNSLVSRVSADPVAIQEMQTFYNTTGQLDSPLITLHTVLDQQIPYAHEQLYLLKTILSGSFLTQHLNIPINRFEHCNFTFSEALFSFVALLAYTGDLDLLTELDTLMTPEEEIHFDELSSSTGIVIK